MAGGEVQHWRPGFLEAIDAAMTVRAEDRPQSVAEWRAMLLGERRPASDTRLQTRPAASARPDSTGRVAAAPSGVIAWR
ncbi:MAG: hypothetical protein R3D67_22345 [Hyphomicrobiaceae bacterium]